MPGKLDRNVPRLTLGSRLRNVVIARRGADLLGGSVLEDLWLQSVRRVSAGAIATLMFLEQRLLVLQRRRQDLAEQLQAKVLALLVLLAITALLVLDFGLVVCIERLAQARVSSRQSTLRVQRVLSVMVVRHL